MSLSNKRSDGADIKAFYVRQFTSLIWMLLAVGVGLTLRELIPWLSDRIELATMALISGFAGIIGPNMAHFTSAGKVITRSEDRRANLLVGAGATLILLLLFSWFVASLLD